jgi:2-polyprenyl-3-methyl-5-hydroxy-6-metoxy-1,4-benzoquinol methylase
MPDPDAAAGMLTPRRRRGVELIDDPDIDAALLRRSLGDVARANALFGGAHAVNVELARLFRRHRGERLLLLDVGTGLGDLPHGAWRVARRFGVVLETLGVDSSFPLAAAARSEQLTTMQADALRLPLRDGAVDVVLCSQLLHHFDDAGALVVLREFGRVARRLVVVTDLRRSWVAAGLFWLVSWPLRFEPVTRHDGTLSVLRGFTRGELADLVQRAVGRSAVVRRHPGFRLSATWSPGGK